MGKKLAIRGHSTRGKEVIELLEMMGGINPFTINDGVVIGNRETNCYYISKDTATKYISWDYIGPEEIDKYEIFTLEEFLEKYPFKVGNKVRDGYGDALTIKSMWWYDELETIVYAFKESDIILTLECLLKYNNPIPKRTHEDVIFDSIIWHLRNLVNNGKQNLENKMKNVLAELLEHIKTTPKEDLEREFKEIEEWSNVGPTVEEFRTFCECVNRKPKYPTTYEECIASMQLQDLIVEGRCGYEWRLVSNLQKLLLCRDAYWKIAGEQMGLDKPWKPDWNDQRPKYTITVIGNQLIKHHSLSQNYIFAFPTEEMRDAFYENFKDLIESCKELL